eukprot:6899483-Pyramimonas_sp.AAC.1
MQICILDVLQAFFPEDSTLGVIQLFSIYLQDQVGMNEHNMTTLNRISPCGGDFNVPGNVIDQLSPLQKFG